MKLEGKVALVTGAGRGIGQGIAVRLAQEGADVAINYRGNPDQARATHDQVRAAGRRAALVQADVSKVAEVRRMVEEAVAQLGRLDILVNNAGIERHAAFVDVTEEDYDAVLAVNLKGVFFGTQAFARHLLAAGRPGRVITISSVHEDLPFPGFPAYCASKGGVRMLTRTLAIELAPHGITVNGIAPGAIATPINKKFDENPAQLQKVLGNIPLGRLGSPADVAGVAAFLASDDAAYVTGSTYFVDGGLTWKYDE